MSDHLIAEANRHAKTLPKMTLPTTKANDRDLAWYIAECIDLKKQLEMECAAKREHMRIACAEINELKVRARVLEQENAALRADKERLANAAKEVLASYILTMRVELNHPCPENLAICRELRAAIDAARKEAQP